MRHRFLFWAQGRACLNMKARIDTCLRVCAFAPALTHDGSWLLAGDVQRYHHAGAQRLPGLSQPNRRRTQPNSAHDLGHLRALLVQLCLGGSLASDAQVPLAG